MSRLADFADWLSAHPYAPVAAALLVFALICFADRYVDKGPRR